MATELAARDPHAYVRCACNLWAQLAGRLEYGQLSEVFSSTQVSLLQSGSCVGAEESTALLILAFVVRCKYLHLWTSWLPLDMGMGMAGCTSTEEKSWSLAFHLAKLPFSMLYQPSHSPFLHVGFIAYGIPTLCLYCMQTEDELGVSNCRKQSSVWRSLYICILQLCFLAPSQRW